MDRKIEINCDLGEGISDETEIISFIDVASIACGGHTGDAISIRKTLLLCQKLGKKAGAHPSYPDQENFGRKSMQLSPEALLQSIYAQIERYSDIANSLEIPLDHIKFHGALYNDAASQAELADMLTDFLMLKFPKYLFLSLLIRRWSGLPMPKIYRRKSKSLGIEHMKMISVSFPAPNPTLC